MIQPMATLTFRRFTTASLNYVRGELVDIYAEVYADRLSDEFFSTRRFIERLHHHADQPQWEAVIGYHAGEAVGYAYGAARPPNTGYWQTLTPKPDDDFSVETGRRTFVLFELMIRGSHRRTGASRAVHDELLGGRHEERVALAVEQSHPRVRALYERWGYRHVGVRKPAPDAPLMDIMVRPRVWQGS